MKLLLDQNLSRRLVQTFEAEFPDSVHVANVFLDRASDLELWRFAKDKGFVILSKDTDFLHLALLNGHPPKVIHLDIGNCTAEEISQLVIASQKVITTFVNDQYESFLILKPHQQNQA